MKGSHCLVTGGAGFIGSHLVERLLKEGATVTVLDDLSSGRESNLEQAHDERLKIIRGCVTDEDAIARVTGGMDYVFHLAARPSVAASIREPWRSHEVNLSGTLKLLERCREIRSLKKIVLASSSAVYGEVNVDPKPESAAGDTLSPYAQQKWSLEGYMRIYHALYGVPGIAIRPFNVYGPRQSAESDYAAVIPKFIQDAKLGQPLKIYGDGKQTRDFVHVSDLVQAFLLAAVSTGSDVLGAAFNCGSGIPTSVEQLAKTIVDSVGSPSKVLHAPSRQGDIRESCADLDRIIGKLGYRCKIGLEEGIRSLLEGT